MDILAEPNPFVAAADRVASRVVLVRFLRYLRATALPVLVVALAAAAAVRWVRAIPFEADRAELLLGVSAWVAVWMIVCGLVAGLRRPSRFAALAFWDCQAGRKEAFASALAFESKVSTGTGLRINLGEQLHLQRSRILLPDAMSKLRQDLPLPGATLPAVATLALLALLLTPLFVPPARPGHSPLTAEMLAAADAEAAKLAREKGAFDNVAGLTEEEKERLEELRKAIEATADELENPGGESAEDVLNSLEERAREAERLAEKLGEADDVWASDEMLAEMQQHADTADLAHAVKDKDASQGAEEAEKLEDQLKAADLSAEVRDRMAEALDRTMKVATEEDRERIVGAHLGEASQDLAKLDPVAAGADLGELAKAFRRIEQRENAQKELDKLAEKLREAGSNIAGQDGKGMQKLAGNEGGSDGEGAQGEAGSLGEMKEFDGQMGGELADMPLPVPGAPSGQTPQFGQMMGAPIPGTDPQSGQQFGMAPDGQEIQDGGQAMLLPAPIPGTEPPEKIMLVPGAGQGSGHMIPITGAGGLQAGVGSTELGSEEVGEPTAASRQGNVAAGINRDGESTVRAVEGRERTELTTRSRQEMAVEFLNVQEEAFDEQDLPLSRRQQVKRYFNAIRKQFEGE
ncbi:hypothetical protein BH23VER1_BH23VER1_08110 [soil metagenome]